MPCDVVKLPDGTTCIVKRSRRAQCAHPDCRREHDVLCDHTVPGQQRTCNRKCCRAHAKHVGPDADWCWRCVQDEARRGNIDKLAL